MSVLPIVQRELRVQARKKRTYRLRLAAAGVAILLVSIILVFTESVSMGRARGHGVFEVLAWLGLGGCLLSGAAITADSLSQEKREGTLGLLFLTDLKGYDVVLGKLLATSLNSFYALTAFLPPLAITLLLGEVTAGEFWRLALLLTVSLIFSLTLGLLVSALSRDGQGAMAWTIALIVFSGTLPVSTLISLFDSAYGLNPGNFWKGVLALHGVSWIMIVLASFLLPRSWQDQEVGGFDGRFRAFQSALLASLRRRVPPKPVSNPVLWLAGQRTAAVTLYLWLAVVTASVIILVFSLRDPNPAQGLIGCALAVHFALAVWVAFQASHLFAEARNSGTLEQLLATPLKDSQIVDGYFLALKRSIFWPIFGLLLFGLAILIEQMVVIGMTEDSLETMPFVFVGAGFWLVVFVSDLLAAARVGMWMAMTTQNSSRAFVKTVLYVMVLPLVSFCFFIFMPLIWLAKNAALISYAENRLHWHLRALLTGTK